MAYKGRMRQLHGHLAKRYSTGERLARLLWMRAEELKGSVLVNIATTELLQLASLEISENAKIVGNLRAEIAQLKRLAETNCREL